jgi:hypothetical protein
MTTSWSQSTSTEGSGTLSGRDSCFSPTRKRQPPHPTDGDAQLLPVRCREHEARTPRSRFADSSWLADLAYHTRGITGLEPHEGKPTAPCALRQTPRCHVYYVGGSPSVDRDCGVKECASFSDRATTSTPTVPTPRPRPFLVLCQAMRRSLNALPRVEAPFGHLELIQRCSRRGSNGTAGAEELRSSGAASNGGHESLDLCRVRP